MHRYSILNIKSLINQSVCAMMKNTHISAAAANSSNNDTHDKESGDNNNLLSTIHILLGSKLRVTMTDGRVVNGNFVSLDRLGNIILDNVVECRSVAYNDKDEEQTLWDTNRALAQAVIPGDRLAKVEIAKDVWKARIG